MFPTQRSSRILHPTRVTAPVRAVAVSRTVPVWSKKARASAGPTRSFQVKHTNAVASYREYATSTGMEWPAVNLI